MDTGEHVHNTKGRLPITESPSHYDDLERMSVGELLTHINEEDALVAGAVRKVIPQIQAFVEAIEPRMKRQALLCWSGNERQARRARCQRTPADVWCFRGHGDWPHCRR